ncbi:MULTISPECIES: formyltransferase family protein [unclassified Psychrobacter]|uniref:formyltransferase family protein n=1 Tax=unclassified Psychrobacter TaxID=196806 RepID=UPI001D186519|nr:MULTISPECIES: formyltransferase family protein [unclassified Psychrobacter]
MIKVMIVGQKWLAEHLLQLCSDMDDVEVVLMSVPSLTDRAAVLANKLSISVSEYGKTLTADDVPSGIDVILMAHAYCFVSVDARAKARLGAVGYHPSLLPAYKGKSAVADAFYAGEAFTGGSLYQLDDGWDTGAVILQSSVSIDSDSTVQSLWRGKLAPLGLELFAAYLYSVS